MSQRFRRVLKFIELSIEAELLAGLRHPKYQDYDVDDRTAGPGRSDSGGSSCEFGPSPNLSARMKKLAHRRIDASWITFPKDAREFRGGHGIVSEARMVKPGAARESKVAIKNPMIGDNKDLEQAVGLSIREAEFLAELTHPNIVGLKGFVEDLSNGIIWLVFPWAEYGNLRDFVALQKWEILERISLISDVAMGLAYLHSRKPPICHGDLKSLNVLVLRGQKCRAAITDFGSARHVTRHDPNAQTEQIGSQTRSTQPLNAAFCSSTNTITLTGNSYSLRWAAPELLTEDQLSLWSDIWALGWIAYEVVTNSLPFEDVTSDVLIVERVLGGELPSVTDNAQLALIHELCSLMTMCWKSDPTERPTADSCRKSIGQMPKWAPNMGTVERVVPVGLLTELGHLYQSRGDSANALDRFVDAVEKSRKLGDENKLVSSLRDLARLHRLRKEYDEAVALYSELWEIYAERIDHYAGDIADGLPDLAGLRQLGSECHRAAGVESGGQKMEEQERILGQALCKVAQHHVLRHEYEEALPLYSQVLEMRTDLGSGKGRADALWVRAEVYRVQSQYDEAIPLYSEVLEIRTELDDREGRGNALWSLADVHRRQGKCAKAFQLYSEVLKIPTDIWDGRKRADALWGLAEVYRLLDRYDEAIPLYSEVLKLPTDPWDTAKRADALCSVAETCWLGNEYEKAISLYSTVLKVPTGTWDGRTRANALWGIAEVHRLREEYDKAIPLYSKVLEIRTDLGDTEGRADALCSLADLYRRRSEYYKGFPLYSEVLKIPIDTWSGRKRADALWGLAEMHRLRDEYDMALQLYSVVLKIPTDPRATAERADALCSVAETHRLGNEYEKAISLYSRVLKVPTGTWEGRKRADALWGLAEVYRLQDKYKKARPLYSKALKLPTDPWDTAKRADALCSVAETYRLGNEHEKAISLYSEVLTIPSATWDGRKRADALWGLAEIHRLREKYNKAISLYSKVFKIPTDPWDTAKRADALCSVAEAHRLRDEYDKALLLYSEVLKIPTDTWDGKKRADTLWSVAELHRLLEE